MKKLNKILNLFLNKLFNIKLFKRIWFKGVIGCKIHFSLVHFSSLALPLLMS